MANKRVSFYGSMKEALGGDKIEHDYRMDPRNAIANASLQSGTSTAPVQSHMEGLARALQGGLGGYLKGQANQEKQDRQSSKSDAIKKALMAGRGTPAKLLKPADSKGPGGMIDIAPEESEEIPGGYGAMIESLLASDNPDTNNLLQRLQTSQMDQEQQQKLAEAARALMLSDAARLRTQNIEDYRTRQGIDAEFASPKAPKTIKTKEGVFILKPDGTLGGRLGGSAAETVINMGGELSKDYQPVVDDAGAIVGAEPIPGGKEDPLTILAKEEAKKKSVQEAEMPGIRAGIQTKIDRLPILKDTISDIKDLSSGMFTSGMTGQALGGIAGTDQYTMNAKMETIKSAVGLQELIDAKASGATFGSLTESEMNLLISSVGALDSNLPPEQLGPVLDDVVRLYEKGLESRKSDFSSRYPNTETPWGKGTDLKSKYGLE